ncbi:hydrogenase maturation nickel metallochaperone HypA [Desulfitobacterium sp. THU1]|uniref:hydrogenase maturation nickel metallochaperone HypA n=1 Tax=Desulfitobacterium sp. THU1 TaxID=3138072 RepID=UPI00311EFC5C
MHEMSLMGGVFEVIERTLAQHQVKKVTLVKLKIGKLTNAEPEALQMAFEAYAKGTVSEGAELQIELIPVKGRCKGCGDEFLVAGLLFACPTCQHIGIDIIEGEELLLESLEVEE